MGKNNKNWENTTLGEICRRGNGVIQTGPFGSQLHASDYVEKGIPTIMPKNIGENRVIENDLSMISLKDAERLKKYRVQEGDIVYSRRGNITLRAFIHKQQKGWLCGTGSLMIRLGKGEVDPRFISYYLGTSGTREWIQNHAVGATMPNLNTAIISGVPISYPPIAEQQQIVNFLSALDAKIELNNRINAELEAMAKTLYDYWFVQFEFPNQEDQPYKSSGGKMVWNDALKRNIPEGWEQGTLSDIGTIVGGSTPPKEINEYFDPNGFAWITPKDLSLNGSNKFITKGETSISEKGLKVASLNIMPKGTILLSSRAPIGYMAITRGEVTTNQGFKSFIPNKGYSLPYVFYTIKNAIPVIKTHATGSTFKEASAGVLKTISVYLPPTQLTEQFGSILNSVFEKQNNLELENQTLAALRDWLLPLLMNGQVKVG